MATCVAGVGRGVTRRRDGDSRTVHVEFLLAIEPGPCKNNIASWHVCGNGEVEGLLRRIDAAIAMRAVTFKRLGHLERGAVVDRETDLTRSAVVIADARQSEVLRAPSSPCGNRCSLRCAQLFKIPTARERRLLAAAIKRVVEFRVCGTDEVWIVGGAKGRGRVQVHVSQHSSEE